MKKYLIVIISLVLAIGITYVYKKNNESYVVNALSNNQIVEQEIINTNKDPKTIHKLYSNNEVVGVVSDIKYINSGLKSIYDSELKDKFPNSSIKLSNNTYIDEELSYNDFENKDEEIFNYIKDHKLYAINVYSVEFSDENGVYSRIFVSNKEIFEKALDSYLSIFVDKTALEQMKSGTLGKSSLISTFGSKIFSVEILENIDYKEAQVDPDVVMTSEQEVLEYLEYGNFTEKEYYTVEQFDTVEGVGSKNYGLSAQQVMNINRDVIKDTNQVLEAGTQLNITYFKSPLDVVVIKENAKQEPVYATDPILVEDPTLREGSSVVVREAKDGSKNVLYKEKWINGVLISGEELSSVVTIEPIQEIINVGTLVIPGVGTGTFAWPVDNPYISCHWGCYPNHRAIDIQNQYNRYGNLYASDRGVVETVGYHYINGNYIIINHNNGYTTYYGHMSRLSPLKEGDVVDKGDVIGQIGMTGWATGPHTHFFIVYNGVRKNPCDGYLDC